LPARNENNPFSTDGIILCIYKLIILIILIILKIELSALFGGMSVK
jgi:hypothetical protein